MSEQMHPLLAQLYAAENQNDDVTHEDLEKIAGPEALALLEELNKQAAAEGIDLNEIPTDMISELIVEAMGGQVKTAGAGIPDAEEVAGAQLPAGLDMEKAAAADYLGRVQAHAFLDEMDNIYNGGQEKVASVNDLDQDTFDKLAEALALDILDVCGGLPDGAPITEEVRSREKVASIEMDDELAEYLLQHAGEMLDAKGYDLNAINEILSNVE